MLASPAPIWDWLRQLGLERYGCLSRAARAPEGPTTCSAYGWFTGGFDTQDPKDAKTLLDELT